MRWDTVGRGHRNPMASKRTTPPPLKDVIKAFPKLAEMARPAVRLHPRRGRVLNHHATKLGGEFAWPSTESWPCCNDHNMPVVGALQINKADIGDFPFKKGTDLFQLVWCAAENDGEEPHLFHLFWRDSRAGGPPRRKPRSPKPAPHRCSYLLEPCRLFPERVIDFPTMGELSRPLLKKIEAWDLSGDPEVQKRITGDWTRSPFSPGEDLYRELACAPGTKIGGWPNWIQYPEWPTCDCGKPMQHLLTVASLEDFRSPRWCPVEDRPKAAACKGDYEKLLNLSHQLGLDFGDGGDVYFFLCRQCKHWPWKVRYQCG